jgi:diaminopimelate epimerase
MIAHINNQKKVYFSKMHGLGNDFMVVNCINQKFLLSSSIIKTLSHRHTGIGFDQLLLVENAKSHVIDFHYRIFNSNGNEVEQCGNGARCFGLFLSIKGLTYKKKISVSTKKRNLFIELLSNNMIKVNMDEPDFRLCSFISCKKSLYDNYLKTLTIQHVICNIVSMGNPHCIIQVQNIKNAPVNKLGVKIEKDSLFPKGINVGFMEIINKKHIKLRVYERDVGETYACGSGACAAVSIGIIKKLLHHTVQVDLLGGQLIIKWKGIGHALYMIGSATHVYDGYIYM